MRILFADDDPDARALAMRALRQEFPQAVTLEAVDQLSLTHVLARERVDILITDYDLRWTDGFAIYTLTKTAHPNCVAVMFTGTGNEELAVRAIKAGFDDYVVKAPGQLKRLANSARLAFERHAERGLLRENREILRKELYHRLHNNLQIVISLMSLTLRGISDPAAKTQIRDLIRRIQALSLLQEQFYRADDLRHIDVAGFIAGLADDLRGANTGVSITSKLEPLVAEVDRAVPLGLIVNEMLMIALGYASAAAGAVSIELQRQNDRLTLTVAGHGEPRPARAQQPGLGSELIARLATQIDAQVQHEEKGGNMTMRVVLAI